MKEADELRKFMSDFFKRDISTGEDIYLWVEDESQLRLIRSIILAKTTSLS